MKKLSFGVALAIATLAAPAFAVQETFTSMLPASCSLTNCQQTTTDNLLTLGYFTTTPLSGPTPLGFQVVAPFVDIAPADPAKLLTATILSVNITASSNYNGAFYIGSVLLSTQDPVTNQWTDRTSWSMRIGNKPIYVMLNGYNLTQPKVKGVRAMRLTGINGTTRFTIGMLNASTQ